MTEKSVRGVFLDGRHGVEVRTHELPEPEPGWALVDVAYAGICGSDLHLVDAAEEPGAAPLGHEFVGTLAAATASLPAGAPVFVNPVIKCGECPACLSGAVSFCPRMETLGVSLPGGWSERLLAPESALFPLPQGVDLRRAALMEPLAICVRVVHRAGIRLGDVVHVVGGGTIGVLVALLARRAGASVTVSEPAAARREFAAALGFETTDADEGAFAADVVVDATGHPSVPPRLTGWVRTGGTVLVVGAYPPGAQGVDLLDVMLRELTIVGSLTYQRADIEAAVRLIDDPGLPLEELISEVVPFEGVTGAIERLRRGEAMKVLVSA